MADKYPNYKLLAASEKEYRDYVIRSEDRDSYLVVIGPHAGGIEPGTSELVEAVAGYDYSFYLFEGLKSQGNGVLHITSTNFDEPIAVRALARSKKAIALHGEGGTDEVVYVGGRDERLRPYVERSLEEAGFATAKHKNPALQGTSPQNICNRCTTGEGLQLELSKGLRLSFFRSLGASGRRHKTQTFNKFVGALSKKGY